MAGTALQTMQQLSGPGGRQVVAMMLAAATAVALAVGAWMWSQTPDYRVLFSNVNDRDGGAIIASLTQMNVPCGSPRYDCCMSFISILFALLLEQARPLAQVNPVHNTVRVWVRWVMRNFDAGKPQHGWLAWGLSVVVPSALVCSIHWALVWTLGWVAAVIWNVAILYATLGFRQFSHHFTAIRDALHAGDEEQSRQLLANWMRMDASALPRSEIVRHVIEHSILSAHHHVFGVFAWYSLLAAMGLGPAGAVLYRVSEYLSAFASPVVPDRARVRAVGRAEVAGAVPRGHSARQDSHHVNILACTS